MYPVSDEFLKAIDSNTRSYYWTGSIVTKNHVTYEFDNTNIVKGSGYITSQCCGSSEIELGTVYASELGITLLNDIDRYTLDGAEVKIFFHLNLPDGSVETVPMGIFEAVSYTHLPSQNFKNADAPLTDWLKSTAATTTGKPAKKNAFQHSR